MSFSPAVSLQHPVVAGIILALGYLFVSAIYACWLHPLSRFPGPWYVKVTSVPFWYACITGKQVQWMHNLHTRYGPVVRYGVNELSYVDNDFTAWKAIHGHQKGGREFPKAKEWFVAPFNGKLLFDALSDDDELRRANAAS